MLPQVQVQVPSAAGFFEPHSVQKRPVAVAPQVHAHESALAVAGALFCTG